MRAVLTLLVAALAAAGYADEGTALERLSIIVSELELMGDVMVGEPVSGTLSTGDTSSLEINLDESFMYNIYIWSDSYFNVFEFWTEGPLGETDSETEGDNASIAIFPDTTATWRLRIRLIEEAYSDSASYAAALFRVPRLTSSVYRTED